MRHQLRSAPVALGLVCPLLDLAATRTALPVDPLLTPEWIDACGVAYTAGADPTDSEISPLRGPLDGLPPAFVVSAGADLLAPDAEQFADAVTSAGGSAVLHHVDGLWHDFPLQAVCCARRTPLSTPSDPSSTTASTDPRSLHQDRSDTPIRSRRCWRDAIVICCG